MGTIAFYPRFRAFDKNNKPIKFGKLYTYMSGTGTPKPVYSDPELTQELPNPVELDGEGEAGIHLLDDGPYRFILHDRFDVPQWPEPVDNIFPNGIPFIGNAIYVDRYADIDAALAAAGSSEVDLVVTSATLTEGTVIPDNLNLVFERGGQFTWISTPPTINGTIEAGPYQIFSGTGVPAGTPFITAIHPEWFGAVADEVADDSPEIQQALNYAYSISQTSPAFAPPPVELLARRYYCTSNLEIPPYVALVGPEGGSLTTRAVAQLVTDHGNGNPSAEPFIRLNQSSSLHNVVIRYPQQTTTDSVASIVQFSPTLLVGQGSAYSTNADDARIENVTVFGAYDVLQIGNASDPLGRLRVDGLYANPLNKGVKLGGGAIRDSCLLRDVRFETFTYTSSLFPNIHSYVKTSLTAFDFTGALAVDGLWMESSISLSYGVGMAVDSAFWGYVTGSIFDESGSALVASSPGRLFCYGTTFVSGVSEKPIVDISGAVGTLVFSACEFDSVGISNRMGILGRHTSGTVVVSGCGFRRAKWPAIQNASAGGTIQVNNCVTEDGPVTRKYAVGGSITLDGVPGWVAGTGITLTDFAGLTFPLPTQWSLAGTATLSAVTGGVRITGSGGANSSLDYTFDSAGLDTMNGGLGLYVVECTLRPISGQANSTAPRFAQQTNNAFTQQIDYFPLVADASQSSSFPTTQATKVRMLLPWRATTTKLRFFFPAMSGTTTWEVTSPAMYQVVIPRGLTGWEWLTGWDQMPRGRRDARGGAVIYATAAPTVGTWAVGDQVVNTTPTAGGFLGFVCVTAGTPGTWKGAGSIAP